MPWERLGRVFDPADTPDWAVSHGALPIALHLHDDIFRIYFTSRNEKNRSQIGFCELALSQPQKILRFSQQPVIATGPLGAFDDSGTTGAWVTAHQNKLYQYYTGWSLGVTVPFYYAIGLSISSDGGETFQKHSLAPVMGRHPIDPFLSAAPCVLFDQSHWRMWYLSGDRWEMLGDQPRHYYHIRYAESDDGINWKREGRVCVDFADSTEYAFGRPSVLITPAGYEMWYSVRGDHYRLGYATSSDGLNWQRRDDLAGLDPANAGWDSEMITYPYVFEHANQRYMLYNGNGYGRSGFGLARWNP